MIENVIKENIKAELKKKHKGIEDFCKSIGKDRNHINRITGKTSLDKIYNIARNIPCTMHDLFKNI